MILVLWFAIGCGFTGNSVSMLANMAKGLPDKIGK